MIRKMVESIDVDLSHQITSIMIDVHDNDDGGVDDEDDDGETTATSFCS